MNPSNTSKGVVKRVGYLYSRSLANYRRNDKARRLLLPPCSGISRDNSRQAVRVNFAAQWVTS